jgi:hypothetical protein
MSKLTPLLVLSNDNKEICKVNAEYFKLSNEKKKKFLTSMINWINNEVNNIESKDKV